MGLTAYPTAKGSPVIRPRTYLTMSAAALASTLLVWSAGTAAQATDEPPPGNPPTCEGTVLTINGTGADDVIVGSGRAERIYGFGGNDTITGGGGNDVIHGGVGADTINGEDGNDCLFGNIGDDHLYGDDNNDYLDGGAGVDYLYGGLGADICVWREYDVCFDIESIRY